MQFRDTFYETHYPDAPDLSDQVLLPNLARGHNVYLATAFTTGYIFKIVRDLVETPEIEPGHLHITFFVPGDLSLKSVGIGRFKNYLTKFANSEVQVAQFISDALYLIAEEGGLTISIAHTTQKAPLVRGCLGVIVSSESHEIGVEDDYVAFIDAKPGDYNSPVKPLKSWLHDEVLAAQDVLHGLSPIVNASKKHSALIDGDEVISWLKYLDAWYVENVPEDGTASDSAHEEEDDDSEFDTDLVEYLQDLPEFEDEEDFEYFDDKADEYSFDMARYFHWIVSVQVNDLERGHVAPLAEELWPLYQGAGAVCPACGEVFPRAGGCPSVDWSRNPDWDEFD